MPRSSHVGVPVGALLVTWVIWPPFLEFGAARGSGSAATRPYVHHPGPTGRRTLPFGPIRPGPAIMDRRCWTSRTLIRWFRSRADRPPRRAPVRTTAARCFAPVHRAVRQGSPVTVIIANDIELRAGSRLLIEAASFRVNPGDRVGFVGRNGAGKTT